MTVRGQIGLWHTRRALRQAHVKGEYVDAMSELRRNGWRGPDVPIVWFPGSRSIRAAVAGPIAVPVAPYRAGPGDIGTGRHGSVHDSAPVGNLARAVGGARGQHRVD